LSAENTDGIEEKIDIFFAAGEIVRSGIHRIDGMLTA
jgi:hypothetical protein